MTQEGSIDMRTMRRKVVAGNQSKKKKNNTTTGGISLEKKISALKLNQSSGAERKTKKKKLKSKKVESMTTTIVGKVDDEQNKFEKKPQRQNAFRKRRRLSSVSSSTGSTTDNSANGNGARSSLKKSRLKRVSFANELEQTKCLDSFDDSIVLEHSVNGTPGKSILRTKKVLVVAKKKKKKAVMPLPADDDDDDDEGEDDAAIVATEENTIIDEPTFKAIETVQKVQRPHKSTAVERSDELAAPKKKGTVKMQVSKKIKEKLMAMPAKERKAFLRELKAKKRPNFELGEKCKMLWETIRSGKTSKDVRDEQVHALVGLVKGNAKKLVYAHDTCRVIECLMALDRPGIRTMLFDELTPEIVRMAKSKYARFFVWKMLKYGNPAQRSIIIGAFRGHVVSLLRQTWSAEILELAYNDYANAQQRSDIITEFYGREYAVFRNEKPITIDELISADPAKKSFIIKNLEEVLKDVTDKPAMKHSIMHRLMNEYLEHCSEDQRIDMIDALKERIVEMVHTRDGCRVAMQCIRHGTAKDRKVMIKNFKGFATKTCLEEYGKLVLMTIFDCVDDTKLVNKYIIRELADSVEQLLANKNAAQVVYYLCHPRDARLFGVGTLDQLVKNDGKSKKAASDRYRELWIEFSKPLMTYLIANIRMVLFDKSTSLLLLSVLSPPDATLPYDRVIDDNDRIDCYRKIAEIAREEFIPLNMEAGLHLIEHQHAHFVVTLLLKNECNTGERALLAKELAQLPDEQLAAWMACNKGCFVLLRIFETGCVEAMAAVRRAAKHSRLVEYSSKGAKLLAMKLAGGGDQ